MALLNPTAFWTRNCRRFGQAQGDPEMIKVAKQAILKVGISGWLKYLSAEDANRLKIKFMQNNESLRAEVLSDLKDVNKAKKSATALSGLISLLVFAQQRD